MPFRGLRRSPLTRPRNARRESSASRSSCARKSGESSSCPRAVVGTTLLFVQRLKVLLHLVLIVARHLLPRDGFLHHLPVLADDAEVLQTRWRVGPPAHQVRVHPFLLAAARLALDAHVEGIRAEALGGIALGTAALALAGEESLPLGEIALVAGAARVLPARVAALIAPPLALAPALEALAVAARLLHGAELVQRALHRLHGLVALAALHRLHALIDVPGPRRALAGAALAAELLHLVEQLAHLLGRELISLEPAAQLLGLLEQRLALGLGEVALEIGQPVHLLEHADPLVALLEEGVEVRRLGAERGVLEHRGEIATLGRRAAALPRRERTLLEVGARERVPLGRAGLLVGLDLAGAVGWLGVVFVGFRREVG